MNDAETDTEHSVPAEPQTDADPPHPTGPQSTAEEHHAEPESEAEQTTSDEQKPDPEKSDVYSIITRTREPLTSTDLDRMGVVQVELTLNVGSKSMTIADVLNLERGSVVSLDRREHDPLDVLINGVVFARGEVVRTGDCYGLRILEIL